MYINEFLHYILMLFSLNFTLYYPAIFFSSIFLFQLFPSHNSSLSEALIVALIQLDSIVRIVLSHSFTIIACNLFSQQSKQIQG